MQEWLLAHDPVAAAEQPAAEFSRQLAVPASPMRRPEARRAFDLWRTALTGEHRAARLARRARGVTPSSRGASFCPPTAGLPAVSVDCDGTAALRAALLRPGATRRSGRAAPARRRLHDGLGRAVGRRLPRGWRAAAGGWALVPDYRLAPEHPFPAALDDALAAYRWLAREYPRAPVIVSGECAGGGLALGLALALRDAGGRVPDARGIHVVSPFCDLTLSPRASDAWPAHRPVVQPRSRCAARRLLPARRGPGPAAGLAGARRPVRPAAAAHPGGRADEALFPQAEALAGRAVDAGVLVTFRPVADSVHSFVLFDFLPETGRALAEFGAFARTVLAGPDGQPKVKE